MEPFSWRVHFRNRQKLRRDWHSIPISGTIEWAGLAGFLLDGRLPPSSLDGLSSRSRYVRSRSDDPAAVGRWRSADGGRRSETCTGLIKFGVGGGWDFPACSAWPCMGSPSRRPRRRPRQRSRRTLPGASPNSAAHQARNTAAHATHLRLTPQLTHRGAAAEHGKRLPQGKKGLQAAQLRRSAASRRLTRRAPGKFRKR